MIRLRRRALLGISIALLSLALTFIITQPAGAGARVQAGEVTKATYKSPRTVNYKSDLKTKEAEDKAAEAVAPVYRTDPTASSQQDAKLAAAVAAINAIRAGPGAPADKQASLSQVLPNVTTAETVTLIGLSDQAWQQTQAQTREALLRLQATQLKQEDLGRTEELVERHIPKSGDGTIRQSSTILGKKLLIPNYLIDDEATQAARNKAKASVQPVSYTIERDQVIVYRGQVVSDFDLERLASVGLTRPAFNWQKTLGIFLLVVLFTTLLLYVAPQFAKRSLYPGRAQVVLMLLALGLTLGGVLVIPTQPILAYVFPVAAPVLLVTIFYGFSFALIAGTCLVALYALSTGGSFELFFIHLASAIAAAAYAGRISSTRGFLRAGALVAVVVFIGTTAFSLLSANFSLENVPKFLLAGALNGALTATFVFAGTAFLGNALGVVTFLQLLELENPRQALLKKLAHEAPGTYSHSLRMAGLVEHAAARISADTLLARVQTLYHDIGKTAFPEYFIENQREETNPHRDLPPKESADLLRAHISEGMALAKGAGLPEQVIAAIPEHHGTKLMGYFWAEAKHSYKRPREVDYRYLGPKPRSKETAILMVADTVEAATRTLAKPTEASVNKLIHELITDMVNDGQLDKAPLSTRELTLLKQSFVEAIIGDFHKRIHYPQKLRATAQHSS